MGVRLALAANAQECALSESVGRQIVAPTQASSSLRVFQRAVLGGWFLSEVCLGASTRRLPSEVCFNMCLSAVSRLRVSQTCAEGTCSNVFLAEVPFERVFSV